METLAVRNQNPGNLKNSDGTFQSFTDPIEGKAALYNDITAKMTGKSKTGINGNSSVLDFAKTYAPASDKNDPVQYAADIANKMGISPDTPIGGLTNRIDDFAQAIASNEDPSATYPKTTTNKSNQRKTFTESINITTPTNQISQKKSIGDYINKGVQNFGDALTFGGATQLGNEAGASLVYLGEKAKGLIGGQDNSKYMEQPSADKAIMGGLKTTGGVGLLGGSTGLLKGLMSKGTALESQSLKKFIPMEVSKFKTLSNVEKLETLTGALKNDVGEAGKLFLQKAIQEIQPLAMKEMGIKTATSGLLPRLIKGGVNFASKAALLKILGDKAGSFVHQNISK